MRRRLTGTREIIFEVLYCLSDLVMMPEQCKRCERGYQELRSECRSVRHVQRTPKDVTNAPVSITP
jgi:hypothetical protein